MQFDPTPSELDLLRNADESSRLHYFLTRAVETEEIWALSDSQGWILLESHGHDILRIWPYKQMASDYALSMQLGHYPSATSLDNFVYNVLRQLIEQNVRLEIMPSKEFNGTLFSAEKLYELFNGVLESGEYYLEG